MYTNYNMFLQVYRYKKYSAFLDKNKMWTLMKVLYDYKTGHPFTSVNFFSLGVDSKSAKMPLYPAGNDFLS